MRHFTVPFFDSKVILARTQAEFERACNSLGVEVPDKHADGVCVQADMSGGTTKFILAWMTKDPATLAHEAVHLAQFILLRAGIDPRDSNGETMAYTVGWVVDRVLKYK